MSEAQEAARSVKDDTVPAHLRNSVFADSDAKHRSKQYKYPHDFGGYVEQQYLPDSLKGSVFYRPTNNGFEREVKRIRTEKGKK
jgi:putative ATPase